MNKPWKRNLENVLQKKEAGIGRLQALYWKFGEKVKNMNLESNVVSILGKINMQTS
jgi:hypothetical protein